MSGGFAFVLDESGKFREYRCNKTSVDLEQVFDPEDQRLLQTWIYRHFDATESLRARYVLENWTTLSAKVREDISARIPQGDAEESGDDVICGPVRAGSGGRGVGRGTGTPWVK